MKKQNRFLIGCCILAAGLSFTSCSNDDDVFSVDTLADDTAAPAVSATGFYVVNEDWFGHDNGTVNFFKETGTNAYEPSYRVYRAANASETLGVTTEFGTIYGGYFYLSSKQGNRLVVADPVTMQKKAVIEEIGGDGRAIAGVSDSTVYIGHSNGIAVFDVPSLSIKGQIADISGEVGNMTRAGSYVFAVVKNKGLVVIDAATNKVKTTIEGDYSTLAQSKDGNVWVAGEKGLNKIDPSTLAVSATTAYPDGGAIYGSWGAWNPGSLCASTQNNALYWTGGGSMWGGGKDVIKYDLNTGKINKVYTLAMSDEGSQMVFYGAGLRVDPLTDNLILTVTHSGWGASYAYNWIYKLDNNGNELTHIAVKGDNGTGASWSGNAETWGDKYFWFPAVPVFEDANKPQILINQIKVAPGAAATVNLDEKIVDYDNTLASMLVSATADKNTLVKTSLKGHVLTVKAGEQTGTTTVNVSVVSNGVRVNKAVQIAVTPEGK